MRAMSAGSAEASIHSRYAFPIDDVVEPPWILSQIPLQLTFVVEHKLRSGEEDTGTLALVLIVEL
jgi:hypothetical protein